MHQVMHKSERSVMRKCGSVVLATMVVAMAVGAEVFQEKIGDQAVARHLDAQLSFFSEQNATGHWMTKVLLDLPVGEGQGSDSLHPVFQQLTDELRSVKLAATFSGIGDSNNWNYVEDFQKLPQSPFPSTQSPQTIFSTECPSSCPSPCPSIPPTCPACPACPSFPAIKRPIPPGYELHPGLGYYRIHLTPVTWFEAKATCEREGAHLVVLNSKEEALMVASFHRKYNIPYDYFGIFIGMHDLLEEGKYYTILGQPISEAGFSEWEPVEPNNHGGNEDCGSLYASAKLNDVRCTGKLAPFVCEIPLHE